MEVRRYLAVLRRRAILIELIVVAAFVAGWLVAPRGRTYTSTATLYVGSRAVNLNPTSGDVSGDRVAGLDRLITTFAALAPTRPVAQAAAAQVPGGGRSVDQVIGETHAAQVPSTDLIRVSVVDGNKAMSTVLANAVATALVGQVRQYDPAGTKTRDAAISIYDNATLPGHPDPSSRARDVVLATLFGLVAAGALVALLEHLDITVRSSDDAERELELPVLGAVPARRSEVRYVRSRFAHPPPVAGGAEHNGGSAT